MNLKTTWYEIRGEKLLNGSQGDFYDDAKAAHKLLAEREWYRLLAWAMAHDWIFFADKRGFLAGGEKRPMRRLELDADRLPVRTIALEQVLRQALEESK